LQHEGERAGRRLLTGELVVIKIELCRLVPMADINYGDLGRTQVVFSRIPAFDPDRVFREQYAAGKKVVFMGTAGVRYDSGDWHWGNFEHRTSNVEH